jgi:hypothetical protein
MWPTGFKSPKHGVVGSPTESVKKFMIKDKGGIFPPRRLEKNRVKFHRIHLQLTVWQTIPTRHPVSLRCALAKHPQRLMAKLFHHVPVDEIHGFHLTEYLFSQALERLGLLGIGTRQEQPSRPTVIGWVTFFDGDEETASSSAHLSFGLQRQGNGCPILQQLNHFAGHGKRCGYRGWTPQFDLVGGGDRTGWFVQALFIHQRHSRRPVPMTVKQRTNDASVDHPRKGLMLGFCSKFHDQSSIDSMRIDLEAVFVRWATAKTNR